MNVGPSGGTSRSAARRSASPQGWSGGVLGVAQLAARGARRSWLLRVAFVLLTVVPLLMAWGVTGDGTAPGRMRAYLALSTTFVGFVLAGSAVFLPTQLARDLADGRLTQALVGPLPRSALVLAWWLGSSATLAALVLAGYLSIGLGTEVSLSRLKTPKERDEAALVLAARAVLVAERTDPAEVVRYVEGEFTKLVQSGRLPKDVPPEEVFQRMVNGAELRSRSLPPGARRGWTIKGVEAVAGAESVTVRFRFVARRDRPALAGKEGVPLLLALGAPASKAGAGTRPLGTRRGVWQPNQRVEVPVDAGLGLLEGSDEVVVGFQNLAREGAVVVFPPEGPELLYSAGGIGTNLARAAALDASRLTFLIAVGAAAAVVLDGNLAVLLVLFVMALGYGQEFLSESLRPGLFGALDGPILGFLRSVLWCLPDLGRVELSTLLANGELVSDRALGLALRDLGVGGTLALVIGGVGFQRRELVLR